MSSRLPVISALSLAVLISATPTVVGQSLAPSRRGGFAGALAHAHYLSNPSSPVLAPFIKEPGNQTSDPLQWSQQSYPGGPDYDLNTMFPGIAALVEINGHSTGNDDIPEWEDKTRWNKRAETLADRLDADSRVGQQQRTRSTRQCDQKKDELLTAQEEYSWCGTDRLLLL